MAKRDCQLGTSAWQSRSRFEFPESSKYAPSLHHYIDRGRLRLARRRAHGKLAGPAGAADLPEHDGSVDGAVHGLDLVLSFRQSQALGKFNRHLAPLLGV